jgi:microcin C transport system substrate-binding protein
MTPRHRVFPAIFGLLALLVALPTAAQDGKLTKSHGLTLGEKLKYPAGFKNFEYVDPNAPKGGVLRMYALGGFDSFNPYIIKGEPADGITLLFDTLMTSAEDDEMAEYGLIAESVEVPDDLSYVIYNLRPEARFSDGTPVTAEDVIFSLDVLREKGAPMYRLYYKNIAKAEALSPHRVKFTFEGPKNRELPQITGQLPVLSKKYWQDRKFDETTLEAPVGSGPYKVASFEPNRFVVYQRVKDWWAKDLPVSRGLYNFDTIRYEFYRDPTVSLEAFKAGRYDFRLENNSKVWATGYDFPAVAAKQVIKEEMPSMRPTGMQGFAFNLRRADKFGDPRVREAIGLAFDFEWTNQNLFYGQYARTESYFSNSELAAKGLPSPEELKLLEPWRGKIPDAVFTTEYHAPKTDGSGTPRENLRKAQTLLREAGWTVQNGKLTNPKTKQPLEIEFLLATPEFERIIAPFVQNLKRLGIEGRIRSVDPAQYINRVRDFDFDMIVKTWGESLSPGNEQREFWSSDAADRPGSQNVVGIKNPAVDALVDAIIAAPDRKSLVTATHALDRVLLWNYYAVPNWHVTTFRLAYWNRFGIPKVRPTYGPGFFSWWIDPAKDAALQRSRPN